MGGRCWRKTAKDRVDWQLFLQEARVIPAQQTEWRDFIFFARSFST
jgi:hypothetical protein